MILGFTGTRNGLTGQQSLAFSVVLARLQPNGFHHGACVGADADAVRLYHAWNGGRAGIVAHPGRSASSGDTSHQDREALELSAGQMPEQTHFARNRNIVWACDLLVATPWQTPEQEPAAGQGGGTWYTIGQAIKVGKRVIILWPDGTEEER